jgi:hypothetical protein
MSKLIVLICAALCLGCLSSAASAEIIDFDYYALPDGYGWLSYSLITYQGVFISPLDDPEGTLAINSGSACGLGVSSLKNSLFSGLDALGSILIEFPENVGFVQITGGDSASDRDSFAIEAYDYKRTLLASVATGLFGGNTQGNDNTSYYIDSATLCVAVRGIRYIHIHSESDSNFGISFDDLIYDFQTAAAPVPEPATMILVGLGLIGLSGLRKRNKK